MVDGGSRGAGGGGVEGEDEVPVTGDGRVGVLDGEDAGSLARRTAGRRRTDAVLPLEVESNIAADELDAGRLRWKTEEDDLADDDVLNLLGPAVVGRVVGGEGGEGARLVEGAVAEDQCLGSSGLGLKLELAINELALLVGERFAVVEVNRTGGSRTGEVDRGDEGDRIAPCQGRGATDEVATREDMTSALEDGDRFERSGDLDRSSAVRSAEVDVVAEVVIVRLREEGSASIIESEEREGTHLVVRDVDVLRRDSFVCDGLNEQAGSAEVELVVDSEALGVLGEDDVLRPARNCGSTPFL